MPVVSAIIPKLYENPCECLLITNFKVFKYRAAQTSRVRHASKRAIRTVSLLLDLKPDSETSPRFRLAHKESTEGQVQA